MAPAGCHQPRGDLEAAGPWVHHPTALAAPIDAIAPAAPRFFAAFIHAGTGVAGCAPGSSPRTVLRAS